LLFADLQMVNMSLRLLSKPDEGKLSNIFKVRQHQATAAAAAAAALAAPLAAAAIPSDVCSIQQQVLQQEHL
jgi:hypothetical protein